MTDDGRRYDEDYFLRGQELGISGYTDYRWMPHMTVPMVCAMIRHLGIEPNDSVLDFGCARGYVVRAFREMGYVANGYDISKWAIDNADKSVYDYLSDVWGFALTKLGHDWVIAKDVLEHVPQVADVVSELMDAARKGVFAVVPLSAADGGSYVVREYEGDVTHIHRLTLATWVRMFLKAGWSVDASYRVEGIKDNYADWPTGNGFIRARRILV